MATTAEDIKFDDLTTPELTEIQEAAVSYMEQQPRTALSLEGVLSTAIQQTGLNDFGADDFKKRLEIWLLSVDEDSDLNNIGRLSVFNHCVRYAANRLKLEDLIKKHPEILDENIEKPIIIAGLPRSGTTHLVNLVASDSRLSSIPYWEMCEPVPSANEPATKNHKEDPRYQRCAKAWETQDAMLPYLKNMHAMDPDHIHEELELENLDFSSYNLEWLARVPRWRDYYLSEDQTPHYQYMRKVIQAIQWQRGGDRRWILKSPQHMEQLIPLTKTFPDATVVITHRDPAAVIVSIITMLAYGDRLRRKKVNPAELAEYWIDRIEKLLRSCVRDRAKLNDSQTLDVMFKEFMQDDIAMVAQVYQKAGLEMTERAGQDLKDYMNANPRGKHGQIIYDLEGDFGVEPNELRERFKFYTDEFNVL